MDAGQKEAMDARQKEEMNRTENNGFLIERRDAVGETEEMDGCWIKRRN